MDTRTKIIVGVSALLLVAIAVYYYGMDAGIRTAVIAATGSAAQYWRSRGRLDQRSEDLRSDLAESADEIREEVSKVRRESEDKVSKMSGEQKASRIDEIT